MGSNRGRSRYVAFRPPQPRPSRHTFNVEVGPRSWRLTRYDDELGILRVPHTDAAEARATLEEAGAEPLTTSGTIRQAERRALSEANQHASVIET